MNVVEQQFRKAWDEEIADAQRRSPSFDPEDYTATGRAPAAYGGKRNAQWWLDNGPGMVQDWIDWRRSSGWTLIDIANRPAVEVALNFELPGLDLPIQAYIDRVFATPTGEPVVVDIKTGSRTPETPEQLGLYRVGLGVVHDIWPDWGYWWTPGKGISKPLRLTSWTPERFQVLFTNAINGINAGAFLPNPANNCKDWCGVARFCAVVGGPDAHGHDTLSA